MKRRILLTVLMSLLMVVLVSCVGTPKELKFSDESVKYENGTITYKGKPYTGKLVSSAADIISESGYGGFVTLKKGHLEGQTKIAFKKDKEEYEINVKDSKLDGQYIEKTSKMGEVRINSEAGALKVMKADMTNGLKMDLTFDVAGLANGTMEMGAQKFAFKDGKAPVAGHANSFIALKYMKETDSVVVEDIQNGKVIQKQDNLLKFDFKKLESELFPKLLGNKK